MKSAHQLLYIFSAVILLVCLHQALAIKCMVCQDCAEPKEDANITRECGKKEDRCIKMVLTNEEVDRACGDSKRCAGRLPPSRKHRSLVQSQSKPEELTNYAPKQRTIRQLLASPAGGGGDGKQAVIEVAEMYCCDEDECNASIRTHAAGFVFLVAAPLSHFLVSWMNL